MTTKPARIARLWEVVHIYTIDATDSGSQRPPANQERAPEAEQQMNHTGLGTQGKCEYPPGYE
jgi:hypothetical protein